MKVVNLLNGTEVEMESILAIYTGPLQGLNNDTALEPEVFETLVHDRIITRDLVLHELNLLQIGFTFWIKIDAESGDVAVWAPARLVA